MSRLPSTRKMVQFTGAKYRSGREVTLTIAVFAALYATGAPAQYNYPDRPLRMLIVFPPGGIADGFARIFAPPLADALGRPVVIENRPGANGIVGAEMAVKSAPDGYTLFIGNISHAINVTLYRKLNYDFVRDFAPVTLMNSVTTIAVVHSSAQVKSVKELIALAKARPGQIDYGSPGSGSAAHLAAALFSSMAGITMNHVPYKGGGPALVALIGGEIFLSFLTPVAVIQHLKTGKLRGLAVTSAKRSPLTPDLPTISESGLNGYDVFIWEGMMVPSGTPNEIISRLHAESVKALSRPDVNERLNALGVEGIGSTPGELASHIRSEIAKWAKLVNATGARVD